MSETIRQNIDRLVAQCIDLRKKDVLILYDGSTKEIADFFVDSVKSHGKTVKMVFVEDSTRHGVEPSNRVIQEMQRHDTVMCITKRSLAHTKARILCEQKGIPFLSMPGYDKHMLENDAFLVNYHKAYSDVRSFTDKLTLHNRFRIVTKTGTDINMDAAGRIGNCCPGYTDSQNLLGSPPDIEANIAPVEESTSGVIVVDGSITDYRIGLLHTPVVLTVINGSVADITCEDKEIESTVKDIFVEVDDEKAYVIGELGIGFNECARLCGNMLIDEGAKGCIHFGIGSNWTIGGNNRVAFHLDFVVKNATITADGVELIKEGAFVDE